MRDFLRVLRRFGMSYEMSYYVGRRLYENTPEEECYRVLSELALTRPDIKRWIIGARRRGFQDRSGF
jgi:hypothetical protein